MPVVNVPGFLNQDRRLPDRRDLNRSFPGSRKGSLTARLADVLFREVIRQSDFGLDLHTAGGERANYPQIRADLANPAVVELAGAFGCPLIVGGAGPEGSLRRTAVAAGVPTVVYEAGSARRFERPFIEVGIQGVLNVLRHLKMMPGGARRAAAAALDRAHPLDPLAQGWDPRPQGGARRAAAPGAVDLDPQQPFRHASAASSSRPARGSSSASPSSRSSIRATRSATSPASIPGRWTPGGPTGRGRMPP